MTPKSYAVPELSPVTENWVVVTGGEFARGYSEAEDAFLYTSYPDKWASLTGAHETSADVVEQAADTCFGSSCVASSAGTKAARPSPRRHTAKTRTRFC